MIPTGQELLALATVTIYLGLGGRHEWGSRDSLSRLWRCWSNYPRRRFAPAADQLLEETSGSSNGHRAARRSRLDGAGMKLCHRAPRWVDHFGAWAIYRVAVFEGALGAST